ASAGFVLCKIWVQRCKNYFRSPRRCGKHHRRPRRTFAGRPAMPADTLTKDLHTALCAIPLIDPHSHIDPRRPTARSLDDILGYHYYTELAHSAGMSKELLAASADPRDRIRDILYHMSFYDNTVQYQWFLDIARTFLG